MQAAIESLGVTLSAEPSPGSFGWFWQDAQQRLLQGSWRVLFGVKTWEEVLPCPDVSQITREANTPFSSSPTAEELRLRWEVWAMGWFHQHQQELRGKIFWIKEQLEKELATWNRSHPEANEQLHLEPVFEEWLQSMDGLTLKEMLGKYFSKHAAQRFVDPKLEALKARYGMAIGGGPKMPPKNNPLSIRQRILIHCIQGGPPIRSGSDAKAYALQWGVTSGAKVYNLYVDFCTARKRLRYCKNSKKKVENLIEDLETILDYLPEQHWLQAEEEIRKLEEEIRKLEDDFSNRL
ncbi:hypothetical protein [Larkinella soli]|uniref:hypothetical protein n=1 Tax=Larkinella soli TaxID=1770527 RepID=UPI000FFB329D|nr:hypothetical protein [Larkinella soli]